MRKEIIPSIILGFAVVIVAWIAGLLALDWIAIRVFDGTLLPRVLANLVGSVVGLSMFVWAFRSLLGSLLRLPGEPWQERLRRSFKLPGTPDNELRVIRHFDESVKIASSATISLQVAGDPESAAYPQVDVSPPYESQMTTSRSQEGFGYVVEYGSGPSTPLYPEGSYYD